MTTADELAVIERGNDRSRPPFERLDDEIMAEAAEDAETDEQQDVERRTRRLPEEWHGQGGQEKSHDRDIGVRSLRRIARCEAARQDLVEGIACGADED